MSCVLWLALGCGATEPAAPVAAIAPLPPPITVATPPASHVCRDGEAPTGAWRYALVGSAFEATQDVSVDELRAAWHRGAIAATDDTARALTGMLGAHAGPSAIDDTHWAIVPAHELWPGWSVITVGGAHPLAGDGPLVIAMCGAPVHNIDPAHLTTLVMS